MSGGGCVYLVGAGPGDPDLLTLKAARLLTQADVIVYDRLVSDEIMALAPLGTPRVFVGKETGCHHVTQDRINEILCELGTSHRHVLRLKGGDPFVFGRGGEEAEYLRAHGVPVEVVPGITSAAACAAAAGVPLTHRGMARSVRFVTGHVRAGEPLDLDWAGLADADTTLVVYMGLATLPQTSAALMAHGLSPATPVLAVENGTTPRERRLSTTLSHAVEDLAEARFQAPTLLVIGRVAALALGTDLPIFHREAAHRLAVAAHG
ncbi:MAG: uroporphyrinogen-III C-methyltransferase [Rhodospirillaceae bacterium]